MRLNPFTVQAETDSGYRANTTLSGTRINTSLRDIAVSIQAIIPEFLEDTGITTDVELLQYTTGTEVAGGPGATSTVMILARPRSSARTRTGAPKPRPRASAA